MPSGLAAARAVRGRVPRSAIRYDPEQLIVDDSTADAVFHAGIELLASVGLYHLDTQRGIRLGGEEIGAVARASRESPPEPVFGQGSDEITLAYRTSQDRRPPILAG